MWTKGHELKYWNKNGIRKGIGIYAKYRKSFELDDIDLSGKSIADIGCGPFGGVFCDMDNLDVTPIDILADEYNEMGHSKREIIYGDLSRELPFDENTFDYIFCTNAIDHINNVQHGFFEIYRVLKHGGIAFVHVHLRSKEELNKAHVHELNPKKVKKMLKGFEILSAKADSDWVNDEPDRKAFYLKIRKLDQDD